jgi:hypothetical protein
MDGNSGDPVRGNHVAGDVVSDLHDTVISIDHVHSLNEDGEIVIQAICEYCESPLTVTVNSVGCVAVSRCPSCIQCETCADGARAEYQESLRAAYNQSR